LGRGAGRTAESDRVGGRNRRAFSSCGRHSIIHVSIIHVQNIRIRAIVLAGLRIEARLGEDVEASRIELYRYVISSPPLRGQLPGGRRLTGIARVADESR
jgi:hypothetical protein